MQHVQNRLAVRVYETHARIGEAPSCESFATAVSLRGSHCPRSKSRHAPPTACPSGIVQYLQGIITPLLVAYKLMCICMQIKLHVCLHCLLPAAIEEGDLAEFKQCLAVLRPLHSQGVRTYTQCGRQNGLC